MVHAIRSRSSQSRPHPDVNRIAGFAVAITINAALLMLLLVPMGAPPPLSLPDPTPVIDWITRKPVPPTPIQVPVTKVQPRVHPPVAQPTVVAPAIVTPTVVAPVIVDHGTEQVLESVVDTTATPTTGPGTGPVPGMHLEYDAAPAPEYPRDALREGVQGTVLLQVLVDVDGRPLQVDVRHSSGDRRLDVAARKQVLQHWRFRPAMQDGHAVQAIGLVPIAFNLR